MNPTSGGMGLDQIAWLVIGVFVMVVLLAARAFQSGVRDFIAIQTPEAKPATSLSLLERRLYAAAKLGEAVALPLGLFGGFVFGPAGRSLQSVCLILGLGVFPAVILVFAATSRVRR
jgi:hypothetical protein